MSRSCERSEAGQAPAELWLQKRRDGRYHETHYDDELAVVRYVRADLYEALQARMAVVRSWNEAPCLEPLGTDYR